MFWPDDQKENNREPKYTEEILVREDWRMQPLKVIHGLVGSSMRYTVVDLILKNIYRLWELNYGIYPCSRSKLTYGWLTFRTDLYSTAKFS